FVDPEGGVHVGEVRGGLLCPGGRRGLEVGDGALDPGVRSGGLPGREAARDEFRDAPATVQRGDGILGGQLHGDLGGHPARRLIRCRRLGAVPAVPPLAGTGVVGGASATGHVRFSLTRYYIHKVTALPPSPRARKRGRPAGARIIPYSSGGR